MFKNRQELVCIDIQTSLGVLDRLRLSEVYTCTSYFYSPCCGIPMVTLKQLPEGEPTTCEQCLSVSKGDTPPAFPASKFMRLLDLFDESQEKRDCEGIILW